MVLVPRVCIPKSHRTSMSEPGNKHTLVLIQAKETAIKIDITITSSGKILNKQMDLQSQPYKK